MTPTVLLRMQSHVDAWRSASDDRALFLGCYHMMSARMLDAIGRREFDDPPWVDRLLHRFADYYFDALAAHESDPGTPPAVWRAAFRAAGDPSVTALQKLLLGVNAHINYDLVLTLVDLLEHEWPSADEQIRGTRRADHERVNTIISRTIDAVQDDIIGPAMPSMRIVDLLMGPADEALISYLISGWRGSVWTSATALLETPTPDERTSLIQRVEANALGMARRICWRAV